MRKNIEPQRPIPKLITINQVSEMTSIPVATLRYWRSNGKGPKGAKLGGKLMYRDQDVTAWIDAAFEAGDSE